MADLGITPGEIIADLPALLSEAWDAYSDDKRISVEEGVVLLAVLAELLAGDVDDEQYEELFMNFATFLRSLSTTLEGE